MGTLEGLENKLKEILYRCLEEIRATKAALYLEDEQSAEAFSLVTSYGFKEGIPETHKARDDLVNNLIVKRAAFFLNELTEDSRFSELLYDAGTSRLLAAPIYSRGRLVGFLDLRDKAGSEPFTHDDVHKVQGIADSYLEVFAEKGLFGQKKIEVSEDEMRPPTTASTPVPEPGGADEPLMPAIVDRAVGAISRGALSLRKKTEPVSSAEIAGDFLAMFLGLPGVVAAGVTDLRSEGEVDQRIVARGTLAPDAIAEYTRRLGVWFERRGQSLPDVEPITEVCFGGDEPPVTGHQINSLMSAPFQSDSSLVLSVVFSDSPPDGVRREMESFLRRIDAAVGATMTAAAHDAALENAAARLIEPDLASLPDLMEHSKRVANLARGVALAMNRPEQEVRQIWLAGLVHDVGSRPLGWERLQRRGHLTDFEMQVVRQHPVVGAAMVARTALGSEIAQIVYSHHEWVNGQGYPEGRLGDQIPLGSRIIHVCEAFDAMTAEHSYKQPISPKEAMTRIRESAGSQFDENVIEPFEQQVL